MAYQQLTLADLRTRLGDRIDHVPFWTTPEQDAAINEGLQFWGLLTSRWKRRAVIETTPFTYEYALPASLTYGMRLLFNGKPLGDSAKKDLDWARPNWRAESTLSGGDVPTVPSVWVKVSLSTIYLWPADAAGHNSLLCDSVDATPTLETADQYVNLGEEDVTLLLDYALHVLTLKKGGDAFQHTMDLLRRFLEAAALENSLITTSQAYRQLMGLRRDDLKPFREAPSSIAMLLQRLGGAAPEDGDQ